MHIDRLHTHILTCLLCSRIKTNILLISRNNDHFNAIVILSLGLYIHLMSICHNVNRKHGEREREHTGESSQRVRWTTEVFTCAATLDINEPWGGCEISTAQISVKEAAGASNTNHALDAVGLLAAEDGHQAAGEVSWGSSAKPKMSFLQLSWNSLTSSEQTAVV